MLEMRHVNAGSLLTQIVEEGQSVNRAPNRIKLHLDCDIKKSILFMKVLLEYH